MALPGIPQTFAVQNSWEMVDKLWWEIEEYRDEVELQKKLWRAFNCAVTAWHICDWIHKELTEARAPGISGLTTFQNYLRENCRSLHVCRYLATASRHRGVRDHPDESIQVLVESKYPDRNVDIQEIDRSQHWKVTIKDGADSKDALLVFYETESFLQRLVMIDYRIYLEKTPTD